MCHKTGHKPEYRSDYQDVYRTDYQTSTDLYGDGDVPVADTEPYKDAEPLPESSRERRDGPGGD